MDRQLNRRVDLIRHINVTGAVLLLAIAALAIAVLTTSDRRPESLFQCGRRLLRSWIAINAAGYSWHPMSIVIDQPTVSELSQMIGGQDGVAIYRVGHTSDTAPWSKRRSLEAILVSHTTP